MLLLTTAMIPNPSDLKYFIEAAACKNFSRAAERLGITQPSLSIAIKRLEEGLKTPVFIRTQKGVHLTQAGKQLLKHSKNLMDNWEQIKSAALSSTQEIQGQFTIGCHQSVALYSLPLFLPEILESYPHLEISIVHDLSRKITEQVISLNVDIGIVVNPIEHPDLIIHKLCKDEVCLWSEGSKKKVLNYKKGTATLLCDPSLIQSQSILKKLTQNNIKYSRVITSNSLEVIRELTAQQAGIGVLPTRVAQFNKNSSLQKISKSPVFDDTIAVIYRFENKNTEAIKFLIKKIRASFKP